MPCYHPLHGYFSRKINPTGKRSLVFNVSKGLVGQPVSVSCGRCIGCRLELSRQWALRCMHEAQLHQENAFVTLTYDDAHLPYGGTLHKKDFQKFIKRVRKNNHGKQIKYYHCGEYGEKCAVCELSRKRCTCPVFEKALGRPHYHALLFGLSFDDQLPHRRNERGEMLYTSATLSGLWKNGFTTVGAVTFESAAYVARYVMKKITGEAAADHYEAIEPLTGEVIRLHPEYTTMSLNPAIAKDWYKEFRSDVYPSDFCVIRGRKMKPPKYYDRLLEVEDPIARAKVKADREREALLRAGDSTTKRLRVREICKFAQVKNLKRELSE